MNSITNNRPNGTFRHGNCTSWRSSCSPLSKHWNKSYDYIIKHCEPVAIFISDFDIYDKIEPLLNHPSIKYVCSFEKIKGVAHWLQYMRMGKEVETKFENELQQIKAHFSGRFLTIIYIELPETKRSNAFSQ